MNDIVYIGESLWVGKLGHLAILTGFVSALFAAIAYGRACTLKGRDRQTSWKQLGRLGFYIHGISILVLMGLIFYAMVHHMYEYKYVFEHVSDDLPMRYILSAFWEGQEGSFMLWMFWHIILGFILIRKSDGFEAPVLLVLSLVELWINSMLLGIHIGWGDHVFKLGSNPVVLIREVMNAPIFANANYLELVKGNGLNPLLQNYWMTIHPPTTFLGFASTTVPFAYAIGGLLYREDKSWLIPVKNWALFSGGILGMGIFMGSLWAYEALSFGGYWAWDPVENTSLVPWIVMIAGLHTNMVALNTGYSIRFTYFSYLASFLLIVYSTLLTRSGILGDTSAHAFTEMGLEWQLTLFLLFFVGLGTFYFIRRWKSIPHKPKEESIYSREFWMFIGSLVLLFSAVLIDFSSSLPVFNAIMEYFDPNYIGKVIQDPIPHYNKYQLWIAVLIGVLSAKVVFMRYKDMGWSTQKLKAYALKMGVHGVVAAGLTLLFSLKMALPSWQYVLLAYTSFFAITANLEYLILAARSSWKLAAAAFSHIGFGLMVIGILASGLNNYFLSNSFIFKDVFAGDDGEKYIQLVKGKPLLVRGHLVTYTSDTLIDRTRYYDIQFKEVDKDLNVLDSFVTRPNGVYSNDFSKMAAFNPDTRHYWGRDIFTCVMDVPPAVRDVAEAKAIEDSLKFNNHALGLGDSLVFEEGVLILEDVNFNPTHPEFDVNHDFGIELTYRIHEKGGEYIHRGKTAAGLTGNLLYKYPDKSEELGTLIRPGDAVFDHFLTPERDLAYTVFDIQQGEQIVFEGRTITLLGFDRKVDSTRFDLRPNDVAIHAVLEITYEGRTTTARPLYMIRGNNPMGTKDFEPVSGLHSKITNIDPVEERFEIRLAANRVTQHTVPFEMATKVPRTDYIILRAQVFPMINFFWIGGTLMMFGLFFGLYHRKARTQVNKANVESS